MLNNAVRPDLNSSQLYFGPRAPWLPYISEKPGIENSKSKSVRLCKCVCFKRECALWARSGLCVWTFKFCRLYLAWECSQGGMKSQKKSNLGLLRLEKEICPNSFFLLFFYFKKKGAWRASKTCLWPIYSLLYGMELCALLPQRSHIIVNSGTLCSLDSLSGETENPSECRLQQRAFLL